MKKPKLNTAQNIYIHIKYGHTGNCRLTASNYANQYEAQRFNAGGGGYCKTSTVLAEFLNANFAEEIKQFTKDKPDGYTLGALFKRNGKVYIDGATGNEAVAEVAKAIGIGIAKTNIGYDNACSYIVYRSEPESLYPYITNLSYLFNTSNLSK